MFRNYLKIAGRNLLRNKLFSLINVIGLALGMACCMLIALYVNTEWSFDRFNPNIDRVYMVNKVVSEPGKNAQKDALSPGAMAPELEKVFPEVEKAVRVRPWFTDMLISYGTTKNKVADVIYADAAVFEVLGFKLLAGNPKNALVDPQTAVISEEVAHLFFGNENPIGKTLMTLNDIPVTITGIVQNQPKNSHLPYKLFISWATTTAQANAPNYSWMNNWLTQVLFTYVLLKEGASADGLAGKLQAVLTKNLPERAHEYQLYLQSLSDVHLKSSDVQFTEAFVISNEQSLYLLVIIAFFILFIACFNFINLSTSRSLERVKEVGVRKVLGAYRKQLHWQFFGESFLLCITAVFIALIIIKLCLPAFNQTINSSINPSFWQSPIFIIQVAVLTLLVSSLAGIYPALHLSNYSALAALRQVYRTGKGAWLRKGLVITQFTLSIMLIIGTWTVSRQTNYMLTEDVGFDKAQLVTLPFTNPDQHPKAFMASIKSYVGVIGVTASNRVPSMKLNGYGIIPEGYTKADHLMANTLEIDHNFYSTYNIKPVEGRTFLGELASDSGKVVINQAMKQYMGWTKAVGKKIDIDGVMRGEVVGVVNDFHLGSMRESIAPLVMYLHDNPLYISVKVNPERMKQTLDFLKLQWASVDEKYPFEYEFLDERYARFYEKDSRLLDILQLFTGLAIFIACLGLFGLATFTAEQRTKEIGVRKVLGASIASIVTLLSKDFLKLVGIAIVLASPLAWYAMHRWLQDFAYRITIEWWVFVLAGALAVGIALLTVSFQSIKAALMNPVKSLRSE